MDADAPVTGGPPLDVPPEHRVAAERIRRHLVVLRGGAPFLSPTDAALLVQWLDTGVSVATILVAVEQAADRRRRQRRRAPLSLSHAAPAVKAGKARPPLAAHPHTVYGVPTSSHGVPTSSHGVPTSSHGVPTSSHGAPTSSHGVPPSSHGVQTSSRGVPPSSRGVPPGHLPDRLRSRESPPGVDLAELADRIAQVPIGPDLPDRIHEAVTEWLDEAWRRMAPSDRARWRAEATHALGDVASLLDEATFELVVDEHARGLLRERLPEVSAVALLDREHA